MLRHNGDASEFINGHHKIRKRVCSSSSSTPSMLKSYRVKRAILVAKKERLSTPVPTWKMKAESPSSAERSSEASKCRPFQSCPQGSRASVSARKLATALWELNEIPPPQIMEGLNERNWSQMIKGRKPLRFIKQESVTHHLADPSNGTNKELYSSKHDKFSNPGRRLPRMYQKCHCNGHNSSTSDTLSNACLMEIESHSQCTMSGGSLLGTRSCLRELKKGVATLKELLKILIREGDHHAPTRALASALCVQVDEVRLQANQLIRDHNSGIDDTSFHRKKFLKENDPWRSEEHKMMKTTQSIMEKLEIERKLRRRSEQLNKELRMELAQMKTALLKVTTKLEGEKRTREIIEQVCSEMVRDIGKDKTEVEELKRESAIIREELEKEREMLQLADAWREERVHMKLSEAKFQFEEKNAAVDQLRNELEAFLAAKRTELISNYEYGTESWNIDEEVQHIDPKDTAVTAPIAIERADGEEEGQEGDDETDSEDSDLHSIELNMHSNRYSWNHATGAAEEEYELVLNKESNDRTLTCHEASTSRADSPIGLIEEIKVDFIRNFDHLDKLGEEKNVDSLLDNVAQKLDQNIKNCTTTNGYREQRFAASQIVLPRAIPSPTRKLHRHQTTQNANFKGSKVADMLKAIHEGESKARFCRNRSETTSQIQVVSL